MTSSSHKTDRSLATAEAARETGWKKPSFVRELFLGQLRTEQIFPFPQQSAEDRQTGDEILGRVRDFLAAKVDADRIDREGKIPPEVVAGLRELGLFGIKIPAEFGGLGLSQTNYNRIIQLVASHCASTAVMLSAHQSIGVPQPLKMFGSAEQQRRYLPRLAQEATSAFALTEPEAGSDPSRLTTTATVSADGRSYTLNGQKLWITNGPIADLLLVMARTNGLEAEVPEITAFIVEGDAEGLSVAQRCAFMGIRGVQNGLLRFENVRVDREDMVGEVGGGLRLALRTLNTGRLTLPAACGGAMKQILAMAGEWAKERQQWGAPVGQHQAVAAKLATIAAETYAVEALTDLTSALADAGESDIRLEAAMAKLYCTEALWRAADAGVQIRGGRGYETADSLRARGELPMPMERILRDARINTIIEGTSEIMRLFIAREALDFHLQLAGVSATAGQIDYGAAARYYATWYPRLWLPRRGERPSLPRHLRRHLRFAEHATRRLARDLFHCLVRHRQTLQRKQLILGRLVDGGSEIFAMCAVLAKAASANDPGNIELTDLFCRQARRRLTALHRNLYGNDDRCCDQVARSLLQGKYPDLESNILSTWKDGGSGE